MKNTICKDNRSDKCKLTAEEQWNEGIHWLRIRLQPGSGVCYMRYTCKYLIISVMIKKRMVKNVFGDNLSMVLRNTNMNTMVKLASKYHSS